MKNYFEGCNTSEEVRVRYKSWVKELHPDVKGVAATAEFQEMCSQYEKRLVGDIKGKNKTSINEEEVKHLKKMLFEYLETFKPKLYEIIMRVLKNPIMISPIGKELFIDNLPRHVKMVLNVLMKN